MCGSSFDRANCPLAQAVGMHRRQVLRSLVAAGGTAALAACLDLGGEDPIPEGDPAERPDRQHAWNDAVETDDHGNVLLPTHHVFLSLDYNGESPVEDRERLEEAFLDLEHAFEGSHQGLLFTAGYSRDYLDRYDVDLTGVDCPRPEALLPGENSTTDEADIYLHLASERARAVLEAEEALLGDDLANDTEVSRVDDILSLQRRRTGFFGYGLPNERDLNLQGVPRDGVHEDAPFFMDFDAGFRENQATEGRVTIEDGPFAGGTIQHVATIRLQAATWSDIDGNERVGRMFSPELGIDEVGAVAQHLEDHNNVTDQTDDTLRKTAREHGIVGHAQKLARHREDGRPPILRRDVNSDDDNQAWIQFVAFQRTFSDFERLQSAMAGETVTGEGEVGQTINNGILQYINVSTRGTFLVPQRERRSLPA